MTIQDILKKSEVQQAIADFTEDMGIPYRTPTIARLDIVGQPIQQIILVGRTVLEYEGEELYYVDPTTGEVYTIWSTLD